MGRVRIAVATKNAKGLDDEISDAFGRSKKITIIDADQEKVAQIKVIDNPALSFRFGAGPILVKELLDMGVDIVVGSEFGPGAGQLLKDHGVLTVTLKPGTKVSAAIDTALRQYAETEKA